MASNAVSGMHLTPYLVIYSHTVFLWPLLEPESGGPKAGAFLGPLLVPHPYCGSESVSFSPELSHLPSFS